MIQIIYDLPDFVRIEYHPDRDFIALQWTSFAVNMDQIKEMHEKTLATVIEKKCFYYVAETSKVRTVFRADVIKWWGDIWVPKMVAAGLKAIVTVVPTSALATSSTHTWQAEVVGGIIMKNVKSFVEAMVVVKQLQSGKKV